MKAYRKEYILKDQRTLVLRTPEVSDAEGLIQLMKVLDSETRFLAREPEEFQLTLEQEQKFIEELLKNERRMFLVAEVEGELVGTCSVGVVMNQRRFLHRAAMGIAIKKAFWHVGIGRRLMQEAVNWCKDNGIEQLELDVVTGNERAIAMYKDFGFEIQGTRRNALKYGDGTYGDEHFMCCFISGKEEASRG